MSRFNLLINALGPKAGWVIVSLLIGFVLRWISGSVAAYCVRKKNHLPEIHRLIRLFGGRTQLLFTLIALHFTLPLMGYSESMTKSIDRWIQVSTIIAVWIFLARVLRILRLGANQRYDMSHPDNLLARKVRTQLHYLEEVGQVVIGIVAFSLILMCFDRARRYGGSLIASAGFAGVIIGFSAQRFLASVIAGLQIAFTQPLRIDDVVIVEGEWGRVQEISLTYLVIETWDHRALVVPITYFVEKPFQNWTRTGAELLGTVIIYADYTLPIQPLRKKFEEVIHGSPLWNGEVGKIHVTDTTEKSMQIRALVSARNASDTFDLRAYVREELIRFIQSQSPEYLPKARVAGSESREKLKRDGAA